MGTAHAAAATRSATDRAVEALGPALVHHAVLPGRREVTAAWPEWVDEGLRHRLQSLGVSRLWRHQAVAADLVWQGTDVALATGTASGKSLAYLLPAVTWARAARPSSTRRATTLYLAPTKALAADQASAIERLAVPDVRAAVVDGDSSREERDWARRYAHVVLTNPDMLHRSLLPAHRRWAEVLAGLRLVVVDESHHYRGVFGSHVAWVLRRLLRVAASYGAHPQVLALSATTADPAGTARRLAGRAVTAVTDDCSPSGPRDVLLADATAHAEQSGQQGLSAVLLAELCRTGHPTIAFVRSRRASEAVAEHARTALAASSSQARVAAYRGGYLPQERRSIERDLRSGALAGVAATSALELGVDIAGMDAVLVAGWPGTRSAFWQQAGRAGRDGRPAAVVFLAGRDPLEQYVTHHPDVLVGAPLEQTVIDPDNPYVLAPHLCAGAAELPWRSDEVAQMDGSVATTLDDLAAAGTLRRRPDGWYWPRRERPSDASDIRGGGGAVNLVEPDTGRLLGTVDAARAPVSVHPGAVYVHRGEVYLVTDLDLDEAVAFVVPTDAEYDTQARTVSEVAVVAEHDRVEWGASAVCRGTVDVTSQVVAYQRRRRQDGRVLAEVPLQMPERRLRTAGCWWTVPDEALHAGGLRPHQLAGAAHAAEHASIGLLPLFATCDRWDIGGVSTVHHPDTGCLTVVVHDAHPGGAGFAARGFEAAAPWLIATRDAIATCGCQDGCPSCVHSPKCGNGNAPLDKRGAVTLLSLLLDGCPR